MDFIYARQSIDKADSISIESQIEYCRYETRGGAYQTFSDRGYSGRNTKRPKFQKMLEQIRRGQAQRVIVYKLDRISRSILDFANMMAEFQQHGVEFVSCTEKFDTSTPMGRAMLNICIVFAQLERETIQLRVTDAYAARMKRGFFMGGHIPYGFRTEPVVIDGVHTSRYVMIPEEAEHIRLICALYADPRNSIGDVVRYLQQNGIVNRRGKAWGRDRIIETIKNPVYVRADQAVYDFYADAGAEILSEKALFAGQNGCFLFTGDQKLRKELHIEGAKLILAPHEGIVESAIWLACRRRCMGNRQVSPSSKAKWTWLAGKIKCAECGYALIVKNAPPYRYKYLVCSHRYNTHACTSTGVLHLEQVESRVEMAVKARLDTFGVLRPGQKQQDPRLAEQYAVLQGIESEKKALLQRILTANASVMELINARAQELDTQKREAELRLQELRRKAARQDGREITDCSNQWDRLDFTDKRRVLDILTERILVSRTEIHIIWKT